MEFPSSRGVFSPFLLPIAPEEVSVNISESSQKLIGHRLSAMILNKVDVIVGM